jgi:flagellar hook-associated protein 3 FlgL
MLINKSMYPVKAGYSAISTMQGQLGKLQTQLGSGQKAQTLAEMGSDRTVSLATRGRLTKLESFSANIDTVHLRLGFLDQAFTALNGLKSETRNSATPTSFGENGLVMASLQKDSENRLSQLLETLNLSVAGRYLMGGNKTDSAPVKPMDVIMNGQGSLDGFKTVVNERNRADLGADQPIELGEVGLPNTRISGPHGNYLSVSSHMFDAFGYKLASVSSNAGSIKTVGPTANPINQTAYFSKLPEDGDTVSVTLKRQDGSPERVDLMAVLSPPANANQYQIFPDDMAGTAANFQKALEQKFGGDLDQFSAITTGDPAIKITGDADGTHQISIKLETNPVPGDKLSVTVQKPDGTFETLSFIAHGPSGAPLANDQFAVGATRRETMANLEEVVKSAIGGMDATVKTGRLDIGRNGATVEISKNASTVFGFGNITSISTTIGKATLTAAPNPSITMPNEVRSGEAVSFGLTLPDGSTTTIRLSAVDRNPSVGQFRITPNPEETARNFEAALRLQLDEVAKTELVAASTFAAANDFFTEDGIPKRVNTEDPGSPEEAKSYFADSDGPPPVTDGTDAANRTVIWYTGEIADTNPRLSATSQVDDTTKVGYGVRANESGLLELVRTLSAMSVQEYRNSDPTSKGRFSAMVERQMDNMSTKTATDDGSVERIALELGVTKATVGRAAERNVAFSGQLQTLLSQVETVGMEETVMELLALKTRLEASYQTTAQVANLSLVNYLK